MILNIQQTQGSLLDFLVAKAVWPEEEFPASWFIDRPDGQFLPSVDNESANPVDGFYPQQDWSFFGHLLSKHDILPFTTGLRKPNSYGAHLPMYVEYGKNSVRFECFGETPLIAAWRCFVAWRLGKYSGEEVFVEVPDEFIELAQEV